MTRRLTVVLAAGLIAAALATESADALLCTRGSLEVWPPPGKVPAKPVFVLHATAQWSSWLAELSAGQFHLETEAGRIDLLELQRFEGERTRVTQVVLAPAEPLRPDHAHALVVDASPGMGGRPFRPPQRWWVEQAPDRKAPAFAKSPRLVLNQSRNLGSGPRTAITFDFESSEEPVLVLADIGPDTEYYRDRHRLLLFPREGRVGLYSGPCGGNFRPVAGKRYLVRLQLMDAGGNVGGGPSHRVTFEGPGTSRGGRSGG
jgi:hypothetical protein